jgi:hypothetical protein
MIGYNDTRSLLIGIDRYLESALGEHLVVGIEWVVQFITNHPHNPQGLLLAN